MRDILFFTFQINRFNIHWAALQTGSAMCTDLGSFPDPAETPPIKNASESTQGTNLTEESFLYKTQTDKNSSQNQPPNGGPDICKQLIRTNINRGAKSPKYDRKQKSGKYNPFQATNQKLNHLGVMHRRDSCVLSQEGQNLLIKS
jgi:hypothetical protein